MGKPGQQDQPSILMPYPGPSTVDSEQDIFVYLRPESNGVVAESTMLRVIEHCGEYRTHIRLIYLANLPGGFILHNHIVEQHYALKLKFAVHGAEVFTPYMQRRFEEFFKTEFSGAPIIGAFEALRRLQISPDELFETWVPAERVTTINGQCIKLVGDFFVVNYDIPALLHKNNRNTDIAVMIFRTDLSYEYFAGLVKTMRRRLEDEKILGPVRHYTRVFHYSRGPFDQILDGIGHLYDRDGRGVDVDELSFGRFLRKNGVEKKHIEGLLHHPIVRYIGDDGAEDEGDLFSLTQHTGYKQALALLNRVFAQVYVQPADRYEAELTRS